MIRWLGHWLPCRSQDGWLARSSPEEADIERRAESRRVRPPTARPNRRIIPSDNTRPPRRPHPPLLPRRFSKAIIQQAKDVIIRQIKTASIATATPSRRRCQTRRAHRVVRRRRRYILCCEAFEGGVAAEAGGEDACVLGVFGRWGFAWPASWSAWDGVLVSGRRAVRSFGPWHGR